MRLSAQRAMLTAAAATSVLLLTAACGSSESSDSTGTDTAATSSAPDSATDDSSSDSSGDSSSTFADGDYSAEGSYSNPGGESTVKVDLTIADNKVTEVTVTPEASNGTSKQYQTQFAGGVADEVVGKSLADVEVSKVAGSSLTSEGFNQAVDKIKAEAQA